MTGVEQIEIVTGEGRFHADAAGSVDASCVVLLHGFPQSRHTWYRVLPALAAAGFRAVAPDQRGYSAGMRPQGVDAYRVERLVQDVLDIFDALGVRRAHLVGHDWGGQVAWMTAAHHPDRVTSLCVLSRPHPAAFAHAFARDPEQVRRSGHHSTFQAAEMTDVLARDRGAALRVALREQGVPDDDIDAYLSVISERAALDAALNWYRAAADSGLRARRTAPQCRFRRCTSGATATPPWVEPQQSSLQNTSAVPIVSSRSPAPATSSPMTAAPRLSSASCSRTSPELWSNRHVVVECPRAPPSPSRSP